MNHQNRRKQRSLENKMNNMIRQLCCWNCFQVGHKRFQCPFLKTPCCSFCRKPSVLTVNCGCDLSKAHIGLHIRRNPMKKQPSKYENDVIVPKVNEQNGSVEYKRDDNLVVFIENESTDQNEETIDNDILEIHVDNEFLNNI